MSSTPTPPGPAPDPVPPVTPDPAAPVDPAPTAPVPVITNGSAVLPKLPSSFDMESIVAYIITIAGMVEGFLAPFGVTITAHESSMVSAAASLGGFAIAFGAQAWNTLTKRKAHTAAIVASQGTSQAVQQLKL